MKGKCFAGRCGLWMLLLAVVCGCFLNVQVPAQEVKSVELKLPEKILWVGEELELQLTVSPAPVAKETIRWEVSDPQIVEVVRQGQSFVLKVKQMGRASVTVKVGDASATLTFRTWNLAFLLSIGVLVMVLPMFAVVIVKDEHRKKQLPERTEE